PEEDQITCIAQDTFGDMYAGGFSRKGSLFWCLCPKAMVYKLNPEGDTIFSKWTDIYGEVNAIYDQAFDTYKHLIQSTQK
ncbi:MAG: hypothetical protein ACK55Z_18700, partial [bacterium]